MQIKQVTAIILMGVAASLALAGADDISSPYPQNVRVNINVAEIAEVQISDDITLQEDLGVDPAVTGETSVYANANFDYQIILQWEPDEHWDYAVNLDRSYVGAPVGQPGHERLLAGPWSALEPVDNGRILVEATPEQAGGPRPIVPGVATAGVAVHYGDDSVGTVHVTITHQ